MTPAQFAEAERLFDAVIDLPAGERAGYLDAHCDDDDVRAEVDRMIQHDATLALGTEQREAVIGAEPTAGTAIGPYTILEQIGEGGFGVVYLAEQKQPVRRRVALKIIKLGMDTKQVIARFEAERQALAMMDHPNIAKVLDAGATETGRPYFVMELVRGQSITDYCDRHTLSVEDRLDLFTRTCHAVQHAHQKGIIHRDIKPSNVLVTLHDNTPVPKVIDFGIAKATSHRLTEKTLFTGHRQFVGTPEYMSPEQAEASAVDIDTRSDVYSLGVLLYELLTGTTPFDSRQLREAAYGEIQRIIREETPHKPSTRLSTIDELPSIAARRRTEPKKLGTFVRGDLDWIVMKALEKDRTRRYETASGFADDIERFIQHEPVVASPPSAAYRVRKFVRRNRSGVVAASFVAVALVLGVVGTTWGMVWALDEKERADHEATNAIRAKHEAATRSEELQQVADFQSQQLTGIDAGVMGLRLRADLIAKVRLAAENAQMEPSDVDARVDAVEALIAGVDFTGMAVKSVEENVLATALDSIETRFADQPLVRAQLLASLGHTARVLGLYDFAEGACRQSMEIRREMLGRNHELTLNSAGYLAYVQTYRGEHDEAHELFYMLYEQARNKPDDVDALHEATYNLAGHYLEVRKKRADAEPLLREIIDARESLGDNDEHTLHAVSALADILMYDGRYAESEPYMEWSLEGWRELYGDEHRWVLMRRNSLGRLLVRMQRYEEAERVLRQTLAARRRVFGDVHPDTLDTMIQLARLRSDQREWAEAHDLLRRVLDTQVRILGNRNLQTAATRTRVADLMRRSGHWEEAAAQYGATVETYRQLLGDDDSRTIDSRNLLGLTYRQWKRYEEAEPLLRTSLEDGLRVLGPDHIWVGRYYRRLARCYYEMGRFDDALVPALAELEQRRRTTPESSETANALRMCGQILVGLGRLDEAEAYQQQGIAERERILEHRRSVLGADDRTTIDAMNWLAMAYSDAGQYETAAPLFRESLDDALRCDGSGS